VALTFPLSTANFMDLLLVQQLGFDTPEQVEVSQTGGGEIMLAAVAPMLWQGEVKLGDMTQIEAAPIEVRLDLLRAGRNFYAYDLRRPAPRLDPTGSILGASTPSIYALVAGNREMQLQGLPVGYRLSAGDYLAFDYTSASVVRRALHRVVADTAGASAGGISPTFEVTPMLRPGVVTGAAVTLVKPACKAIIVPNSVSKGQTSKTITSGASFRFMQTLK